MYRVVSTDLLKPGTPDEAVLKDNGATLIFGDCNTESELIELVRDADAIINIRAQITSKVIDALKRCRVIVRRGVGFDTIDLKAATAKGIPVANVPDFCTDEVADHTMAFLLFAARKLTLSQELARTGQAKWAAPAIQEIPGLKDSVLGLVGFGRMGRAVATRAASFGIQIQVADPFVTEKGAAEAGVKLVSLEELIRTSDFISLHTALNNDTRGMFSRREFEMMKPTAVLINMARGPIVDEAALIEALNNKSIAFAALDVLEKEPPSLDNALLNMDNAIVTPHIGWYSKRAARMVGENAAKEVVRVLKGYLPEFLVNPEVIKTRPDLKKTA